MNWTTARSFTHNGQSYEVRIGAPIKPLVPRACIGGTRWVASLVVVGGRSLRGVGGGVGVGVVSPFRGLLIVVVVDPRVSLRSTLG